MAKLIIKGPDSERVVELVDTITIAGRSSENKIHIEDKQASRRHCQFEKVENGVKLVDLESRNGTRVNDRVVNQALLRPGDKVEIGKHSITFEDPNFKEPPAGAAAVAPAPAAAAPAPLQGGQPATAGAATEPAKEKEPPRLRRRSGHTTASIERTQRFETEREKGLLVKVGIAAGIFLFILGVLIFLPTGSGSPRLKQQQTLLEQAQAKYDEGKLEDARSLLSRINHPEVRKKAEPLLRQLKADAKRLGAAVSKAEEDAFDALYTFCENNRGNPREAGEVVRRCEEFKKNFPTSEYLPRIDQEYLPKARAMVTTTQKNEVTDAEKTAKDLAGRKEFASAIKKLNELLGTLTEDIEARQKIVALHEEIVEQAKKHFFAERAKAEDHKARGRRDEAKLIYEALIVSMGDDQVEDLSDYCKIARTSLQGLK